MDNGTNNSPPDVAQQWMAFTKFWTDAFSRMGAATAKEPLAPPPELVRQMRDALFKVTEEYLVAYLRSPEFLEMTRQSMDAALTWRKQVNDMITATRHEFQETAKDDVDAVLRSVKHLETRLLDRIEELEVRLEKILQQLKSVGKAGARSGGGAEG